MATSNLFQHKKPMCVLAAIFLLLLNKVNSSDFLTFSFTKFVPDQPNLLLQGDATVSSTGKLQLTKVEEDGTPKTNSVGRALYAAPVRIWDSSTGNVANFVSSFSFVIDAPIKENSADGIAFFLAPVDTQPQRPAGLLGLFDNKNFNKSNQIVAVEFDTFFNEEWDPIGRHIGINVNSIQSLKTIPWNLANRQVANVVINYQASNKLLVASLVYPNRKTSYIVSANVDVKDVLPEWVRLGFSAATGQSQGLSETHELLSWSFRSKFPDSNSFVASENSNPRIEMNKLDDSV